MKIAWISWEEFLRFSFLVSEWTDEDTEDHKFCEAPRHRDQNIPTKYISVLLDTELGIIQTMCYDCMDIIATDLNTTPEQGTEEDLTELVKQVIIINERGY